MRYYEILSEDIQVWHGSPHDLSEFDVKHIGNGEGHAAYGWGLYFAAERAVADYYADTLTAAVKYKGKPVVTSDDDYSAVDAIAYTMIKQRCDAATALHTEIEDAEEVIGWMTPDNDRRLPRWQKKLAALKQLRASDFQRYNTSEGKMYAATIPDGPYLYWDRSYKEQPKDTKAILRKMTAVYPRYMAQCIKSDDTGEVIYRHCGNFNRNERKIRDGSEDKQTSLDMLAAGILGIAYFDEESRDIGEGSYNYVIFDGGVVKIKAA